MVIPHAESCDTNDVIPTDLVGKLIYAAKFFGPTTILAAVLVWQGIRQTDTLQQERRSQSEYQREQTTHVVEALANSTHAIEKFSAMTESFVDAVEKNSQRIDDNTEALQQTIIRLKCSDAD